MNKVAYIALIAAFVFGAQPQEAFSNTNDAIEMERGGKAYAEIAFNNKTDILTITLQTEGEKEKVTVGIMRGNEFVTKEVFMVDGHGRKFEINLKEMPRGDYYVRALSDSIQFGEQFQKK